MPRGKEDESEIEEQPVLPASQLPEWCLLLKDRIDHEPPEFQDQIIAELGIKQLTFYRWLSGQSRPDSRRKILKLEELFPELSTALRREFSSHFSTSQELIWRAVAPVYARVMETYARAELSFHLQTISSIVLSALVSHLDLERAGMVALLGQLQTLDGVNADHMLIHAWSAYGTGVWQDYQATGSFVIGSDSLCAVAAASAQPAFYPQDHCLAEHTELLHADQIKSAAAYPVLRSGRIAGVIFIAAAQEFFFTAMRREELVHYAHMIALAFSDQDFYDREHIALVPQHEYMQRLIDAARLYPDDSYEALLERLKQGKA